MLPTIRSTRVILALAVAAVWACGCFTSGMAHAAKLDDAACDALKVERARLESDAIKSDMAKGPQWAKDNLTPERLKEIEQLIGLQESIAFRCTLPKAVPAPASIAKAGDGTKRDASIEPGAIEAATPLTPIPGASPEPSVKPAKKSTVTKKALTPSKPAAKSTSTKKSKAKVSDVYVPPAKNPGLGFSSNAPTVTGEALSGAASAPLSP